ncbi:hypothetical protein PPL_07650 [Heterostelium album PN500]|uniref:Uncharacterized protein n=1 Tax=Heterostelium pallidum (strain ATCC 26659 / Pp 5 / PN500) TaxID=670386 RepID=D3BGJ8_HETP5|nr:hypothetical protein PPL_07650 [Heterostelium album PN500]EFA79232.1 hypothetical protein PPL_07650 [Heterostelium album PN500]|eukprot:XP_020431353.1 hypothetical protein PPL_07650 [Heterostelium album PN500]
MAIQAIESMKWQKKSEESWKQLESHRKRVEDDQHYHNQCNTDKADMSRIHNELSKLQEEHQRVKRDFDQYIYENEVINSKYEELKSRFDHQNNNNNLEEPPIGGGGGGGKKSNIPNVNKEPPVGLDTAKEHN